MTNSVNLTHAPQQEVGGDVIEKYGSTTIAEGLKILKVLIQLGGPQTLKEISYQSGHSPSTTHRYLHALQVSGMVVQEKRSGRYDLGPFATQLGIAALRRVDYLNRALDGLEELASDTGFHAQLAVWTADGPVIVRWERSQQAVMSSGVGTLLPIWKTATGRIFLSYLPRRLTAGVLEKEFGRSEHPPGKEEIAQVIAQVRRNGYAVGHGVYLADVTAIAAPILDSQQQVCAVACIINTGSSDGAEDSVALRKLMKFCREKSSPEAHVWQAGETTVSTAIPQQGNR
jgi:DNA-binding IclR family transcriptional regulator